MENFRDKIAEILSEPTAPEDETMIERLARTLWETNKPELAPDYESLDFLDQGRVKMLARGLLKAMIPATDEMIRVGDEDIYNRMIEAALKED